MNSIFGVGQQGKSATVTAQRHLNLYAEIHQIYADKSQISFFGTPGLELFTTFGDTPVRGWIAVGDYMYAVHRGTFWQVDNAGAKTSRGTLSTTSGRVSLAYNGTQIGITDGTSMYCFTIASLAFATVSSSLFSSPADMTYQDGYGIAAFSSSGNTQRYQISTVGDLTAWAALDFASAESSPDGLTRVISDHGELVMCGEKSIEFHGNTGATDFPFKPFKGSTLNFGLAAKWSLTKFNDSLAGLFRPAEMGQVQVMMLRGHALVPISTPEIDSIINNYGTVSDATAFGYMLGGHPMLEVNFPTQGKSWLYDDLTKLWSPLESGLSGGRHRAEMQIDYLNKTYVADYTTGDVYRLKADVYTDNGMAIPRELISKHVYGPGYRPLTLDRFQVDFETGVGLISGQGSDPQAMLQISRDGGRTWENELWTTIGEIGEFRKNACWRRLGSVADAVFKLRITDPVKVVITGESINDA